jgi:hypothetical protein
MLISIINHTNGQVSDEELQGVIRSINRQIVEDYEPYWGISARCRLEGRSVEDPDKVKVPDMRGDAVIYLWDKVDVPGALGYHDRNNRGIPFGFVFTEISRQLGEPWSVTLSHEVLELMGDPETNLLVMGPHPTEERDVFYWYEMCDAVQAETYSIDGVAVSNFVLPLYFTGTRDVDEVGARNDFLGRVQNGETLRSFGINEGGYVGFFDPETGQHETYALKGDLRAARRMEIKAAAKQTRRAVRYKSFAERMGVSGETRELAAAGPKGAGRRGAVASMREPREAVERILDKVEMASAGNKNRDVAASGGVTRGNGKMTGKGHVGTRTGGGIAAGAGGKRNG